VIRAVVFDVGECLVDERGCGRGGPTGWASPATLAELPDLVAQLNGPATLIRT
jgi:hypothetical protein